MENQTALLTGIAACSLMLIGVTILRMGLSRIRRNMKIEDGAKRIRK